MKEKEFKTVNEAIAYLKNDVLPFLKRVGIRDGGQMVDAASKIIKLLTGTESGMMELIKNLKEHIPAGEAQGEDMDKNKIIDIGASVDKRIIIGFFLIIIISVFLYLVPGDANADVTEFAIIKSRNYMIIKRGHELQVHQLQEYLKERWRLVGVYEIKGTVTYVFMRNSTL
jgi:hypothetical protein